MSARLHSQAVVAIIPARFQSTRFPGKPLTPIYNKPLIQWTVENAKKCTALDHIIVTTDHDQIEKIVRSLGVDVQRTPSSCPSGTDRMAEVVRNRPELLNVKYLVNIQGDEPCIQATTIESVIQKMDRSEADIGTPISPIVEQGLIMSPHVTKCVKRLDGMALYFSRSPIPGGKKIEFSKENVFYRHIGLYAFKPKSLMTFSSLQKSPLEIREDLEMLRALENGMTIVTTEVSEVPPGVDIPEDIEKVKQWIQTYNTSL